MAKTEHYYTKFEEGKFYHVYNRTVDRKPMFRNNGNYDFFLKRFNDYLSPVIDTYAYCLLGNHFHMLLSINSLADLTTFKKLSNLHENPAHHIVSHQFRKFFQSYAMAFNKQQDRIETLFQTPFKRALVDSESYFTNLVWYIHSNPQLHGLIDDFRNWKWSSYQKILTNHQSNLRKQEVINWFGDKKYYLQYHEEKHRMINDSDIFIEGEI